MIIKQQPLVSIIMPVYNTGNIITNTLDSILSQSYTNFELIIVDDGSTDTSGHICSTYAAKDKRIRLIRQQNKGICKARNVGIQLAKGKYLAFCDHDDIYHTSLLETTVKYAEDFNLEVIKYSVEIQNEIKGN
ncbi:glycosyltransferase family 2 protein, partial [Paraprevotella xylaniphila]